MKQKHLMKMALSACLVWVAGIVLAPGVAQADTMAYAWSFGGTLGTVDLNTGIFTPIANVASPGYGLGVNNGNLYGIFDHVFTINTSTGAVTNAPNPNTVGPLSGFGSTTAGLFAVQGGANAGLYSINPTTGVATLIGATGIAAGGGNGALSVSNDSSTLFWAVQSSTVAFSWSLYSLNTSTGAATLLGTTSGSPSVGDEEVNALLFESGTLWAEFGNNVGPYVGTINTSTGAPTVSGIEQTAGGGGQNFVGLAPDPLSPTAPPTATPEPATVALIGSGIAVLALRRRFR